MEDEENNEDGAVVIANVYGDFCVRKARRRRQKVLVREMFYDYANNTTLHGLSYTTKKGLTLTEKIFWLITFIASVCLCSYLIQNVWIKWKTSPVIVTVSEQLVSVRKVPFPSVTICPSLKSRATVFNYTEQILKFDVLLENLKRGTYNESDIIPYMKNYSAFEDVSIVCGMYIRYALFKMFPRNFSDSNLALNIINAAPKNDDIFYYCKWKDEFDEYCAKTASAVLTSEGLCYNINGLAADDILRRENINKEYPFLSSNKSMRNWSLEDGYSDFDPDAYPAPGKENGLEPDLQIVLKDTTIDRDAVCNVVNAGFKVYVQHPADFPQSSLYYYAILNNQVSSMALSFNILNTINNLKKYDANVRQCYFPEERYLKYFKIYTASNCRIECIANLTLRRCGCVGFYMPHESEVPICAAQRQDCMVEARARIVDTEATDEKHECHCLPACNSIDYEAEILKTDFNLEKLIKATSTVFKFEEEGNGTQFSRLEMYFKKPRFLSMRRSELFGLTDFLANIGGLLGLFLGFSFLSLVELFYFLTLRLCCTLKKDLKEEKIQRRNTICVPEKKTNRGNVY